MNEQEKLAERFKAAVHLVECATTTEGLIATVGPALRALADLVSWSPKAPAPDGLDGTSRLGADESKGKSKSKSE